MTDQAPIRERKKLDVLLVLKYWVQEDVLAALSNLGWGEDEQSRTVGTVTTTLDPATQEVAIELPVTGDDAEYYYFLPITEVISFAQELRDITQFLHPLPPSTPILDAPDPESEQEPIRLDELG
mgnify:CR=1 FL=1